MLAKENKSLRCKLEIAAANLSIERDTHERICSRAAQVTAQKHAASAELLQTRSMLVQAQQHIVLLS